MRELLISVLATFYVIPAHGQTEQPTIEQLAGYTEEYEELPELDRYQLNLSDSESGMRDHYLLDTATGRVWFGFIPKTQRSTDTSPNAVNFWVPIRVVPPPEVEFIDVGRYTISSCFSNDVDKFLVDSVLGRIWCRVVDEQGILFFETTVKTDASQPMNQFGTAP